MINIDEPWPDWAQPKSMWNGYAVHHPYILSSWEKENWNTPKTLCNERAANLCSTDPKKVSCGRCRASMGLRRY